MLFTKKDLRKLILPLIMEQILLVAVGMSDIIMISSVGEAAVSGVSLVDNINVLLINIFSALATGGAVVAGHLLGEKAPDRACEAAEQLIQFVAVLAFGVMVLILLSYSFILHTVFGKITPEVMANAKTYLLITACSIPFIALYNAGAAIFRAMSNSRISMLTSIFMNGVNICGNAILIYGMGMGVEGAAIPTLVSRVLAAIVILALLSNQKLQIHIRRGFRFSLDFPVIRRICYIGVPNGLENSVFQLGKIMVLSLVTTFGTTAVAANAVANSVALFQVMPGMAISLAIVTVVSQCAGAKAYDQVKYYTKLLHKYMYAGMVLVNVILVLTCPWIMKAYHLSPETSALTQQILIYHACCCVTIWPIAFGLPNTLRATGDVKFTLGTSMLSMWIWRIAFSYVLGKYLGWGVMGIWVAMTIDWLFRAICFFIRYRGGRWQEISF